ncbi:MAG: endonuclease/exonuclease/phosphatase family protein [Candidatus Accumulibacter sp.]|jgi:endonuclease/exonuclease/phosphatase (EEP) superfamily protein YafD|nr:endonuclease/exonuclease/phosphatase family protein [Accumulibacter sp.]
MEKSCSFIEKALRYAERHAHFRLCLVAGAALLGWTGDWHWIPELFSHAFFQYALLSAALTLLLFFRRPGYWRWIALAATLAIWAPILPSWLPAGGIQDKPQGRLTLLQFNVFCYALPYNATPVTEWISQRAREIDVVLLLEADTAFSASIQTLAREFPYRIERLSDDSPWGIALLSRYPFSEAHAVDLLDLDDLVMLDARITTPSGPVRVVGIHPPNPISAGSTNLRDEFMDKLADYLNRDTRHPTVVFGDFNSTIWSPKLREFLSKTGLRDAQRGHGMLSTWPAPLAHYADFLGVPIDMTLVSPGLSVEDRRAGPALGSDHLPVITRVAY